MSDAALTHWRARSREMHAEHFSARTYDAGGTLDDARLSELREVLETFGAVHVQHTGLRDVASVSEVLPGLGFSSAEQFSLGGRTSAQWQTKWVAPGLRRLDYYPPDLYLLPNNEVQYRRVSPRRVLFACVGVPSAGGRVFLHEARRVEAALPKSLLERLTTHGLSIETGFLDARHPHKAENYFQSWQEHFDTDDRDEALAKAQSLTDEYDTCWWRDDGTLMTRITFGAKWHGHLRFPRLALDPPSAKNGFRRFPLGNGEELTADEQQALRDAYFATREGVALQHGDLVLFDNLRFGHSREAFEGTRDVLVGMAGELREHELPAASRPPPPRIEGDDTVAYVLPPRSVAPTRRFSARTFDARGALDFDAINRELERHGALHVQHTGLTEMSEPVLRALRFAGDDAFPWGGFSSGRTTRRELSRELRATDDYPAHLWLLPHNEVLYQRQLPARLLFFSAARCAGRTFVHSAERFEAWLAARGPKLLASLHEHGLRIEMGFLDERHPAKATNTFRSWQNRFATKDRDEAEARCRAATHQFDACWWVEEAHGCATLMTRIQVPASHAGALFFPRIALDAPALHNGYRRYPRGDGSEFTPDERSLLLHAFLETREGVHYGPGDFLLVDNLRYGHSREAFDGPRTIAVAMAGTVDVGAPR